MARVTEQQVEETQDAIEAFTRGIRGGIDVVKGEIPFSQAAMCGMVLALMRVAIDTAIAATVLNAKVPPEQMQNWVRGMDLGKVRKTTLGMFKDCWKDKLEARKEKQH